MLQVQAANQIRTFVQCCFVVSVALLLGLASISAAATAGADKVQAGFLYNFAQFVSWPEPGREIAIVVYRSEELAAALEDTIAGKQVLGNAITVRRASTEHEILPCSILFVAGLDRRRIASALGAVRGAPVLTVGEGQEFVRLGGMIGLVLRDQRMRFIVDAGATRRAGLRVSSRMLGLAEQVVE